MGTVACDEKPSAPAGGARSEAVVSTAPQAATTSAPAATHAPAPTGPRKLCEADATVRTLPKTPLAHAEAPGAPALDEKIPAGDGKEWTWINFFAAWCGPCKEEIPRLRAWEKKLAAAGTPMHLVFVSLDDDDRQLAQFLEKQPADTGVRSALWLKGPGRDAWLGSMKIKSPPELPVQALIDPAGKPRCVIEGAVEDADYTQLSALVARR